MKKIKIMLLSIILMSIPMLTLAATGHIDGCTNTGTDTSCCTKTYTISAKTGYQVTNVLVNGTSKGAVTSVTLSSIKGPQKIQIVSQYKGPYTITFNANGGSGTMKPIAVANGAAVTLTANAFTRSGYGFKGWATSSGGSVTYNNSASVTPSSHLTLYAVWEYAPYKVTIAYTRGGCYVFLKDGTVQHTASGTYSQSDFTEIRCIGSNNGGFVSQPIWGVISLRSSGMTSDATITGDIYITNSPYGAAGAATSTVTGGGTLTPLITQVTYDTALATAQGN